MKAVYPVYFTKADGVILVEVPDLGVQVELQTMTGSAHIRYMQGNIVVIGRDDNEKELQSLNCFYYAFADRLCSAKR